MKFRIIFFAITAIFFSFNSTADADQNGPVVVIDEFGSVVDRTIIAGIFVQQNDTNSAP